MNHQAMKIPDISGIFAEAFLLDEHNEIAFISLIGKDTAIQEFRARWSIPASQGGLTDFQIETPDGTSRIHLGNREDLEALSGRLPTSLFGELVQVWLFRKLAQRPDYANRRAMQLYRQDDDEQAVQDNLWALVKDLSHLPMLDEWRPVIMELLFNHGWIKPWQGVGGIAAHYLQLPEDELAELLKANIQSGALQAMADGNGKLIAADNQPGVPKAQSTEPESKGFWDDAIVVHSYTRLQAIADGVLVDVSQMAREAGFVVPVAVTSEVWTRYIEWPEERGAHQDESGRLWDVVFMAYMAMRSAKAGGTHKLYKLYCVPANGSSMEAQEVELKVVSGPGDEGEHVITIMLPNES